MADSESPLEIKEEKANEKANESTSTLRSNRLSTDVLNTPLQQSRRNSSVHLEIRKASLMEQESLLDKVLQGDSVPENDNDPMSASDEFARQKRLQELIFIQWDVIDTEDNGDVDVNEWKRGLMKLKVSLTEEQIVKLFQLLDEEKIGFVDRQAYQSFVAGRFNADYLTELQQPLIRLARRLHRQLKQKEEERDAQARAQKEEESRQNITEKEEQTSQSKTDFNDNTDSNDMDNHGRNSSRNNDTGSVVVHNGPANSGQLSVGTGLFGSGQFHEKTSSNLLNEKNLNSFDAFEVDGLQKEMEAELKKQASALKLSLMKEKQYLEDIEEIANTKEDFLNSEKAIGWTPEEVALWLDEMGMTKYGKRIIDDGIDGNILLNDITKDVLTNEMHVNTLHVGKIARAIEELRKLNGIENETPQKDWHQLVEENKKFTNELESSRQRTTEMNKQLKDLEIELNQLKARANNVTAGLDTTEEPTAETDMLDMETELTLYKSELERLCREKIDLAMKTSEEISRLRTAIKVLHSGLPQGSFLSNLSNPMDLIAESLGYSKAK